MSETDIDIIAATGLWTGTGGGDHYPEGGPGECDLYDKYGV